jgi:UDP-N-acetylmuramoylalanine--D-glutamate ligase
VRVLNRDDAMVMAMTKPSAMVVSFGTDAPSAPDCLGLSNEGGMQWLTLAMAQDDGEKKKRGKPQPDVRFTSIV